jgi:hypothetical protein
MARAEMQVRSATSQVGPASVADAADVATRLEVCHELWGRANLAAGPDVLSAFLPAGEQRAAVAPLCLIGVDVAGTGRLQIKAGGALEIREGDHVLCDHLAAQGGGRADGAALQRWTPSDRLAAGRYQGISTLWAFSAVADVQALAREFASALAPGGILCIDEIWAASHADGQALGQALALWRNDLLFPDRAAVIEALSAHLKIEGATDRSAGLRVEIRDALINGEGIRNRLRVLPDEVRRQRLPALARELHRALVLFDALDRGRLTASRHVFRKAA